jgi:hypothetical protein
MTRSRDVANIDGILTATGDTYYASAAATPARLGIGSTGQVMTVAGGAPSWATASSGSMTLLSTTAFTAVAAITISSINQTYKDLLIEIENCAMDESGNGLVMTANGSNANYGFVFARIDGVSAQSGTTAPYIGMSGTVVIDTKIAARILIPKYTSTAGNKLFIFNVANTQNTSNNVTAAAGAANSTSTAAITSVTIKTDNANCDFRAQGNIYIYGVN